MTEYKIHRLNTQDINYNQQLNSIIKDEDRKTAQYIGEGSIFFLLISVGAIFLFKAVNTQLKNSQQQQGFMMAITHELKTPIAISKLNLETLQKRKLDDVQQQRLINNTLQEANRMNALCNNLLLSSQMEAGGYKINLEKLNIADLVQGCVRDFTIRFPNKNIVTRIENVLFIWGDVFLLQMALNNLIDNAIKYAPKETDIFIKVYTNNNFNVVEIKDEGPGISDTEKEKVFKKYYRLGGEATQKSKGTGLGLFLVHKIISAHKGKIIIEDNSPNGAIFILQLNQFV
jgi:K+-sensing histidine kinase KdpD